ncbi:GGDEF domain-containing protein [Paenibacillus bovis]|uniref:GGDEF domain-containing protein n=1 Tax=Paenibacillus bovis TaxID=1616788 RepID=UPI001314FE16|nr:GGDEF domain-containing protein [Paenibacillus bovis]
MNNLTLMTTFLFLCNLLLNKIQESFPQYSRTFPYITGLLLGLLGIGLMFFNVSAPGGFHLDLRVLAIISAVYMSGRLAGGISLIILLLARFLLLDTSNPAGLFIGTTMLILAFVLSSLLFDGKHNYSWRRWAIIVECSMVLPCIPIYLMYNGTIVLPFLLVMFVYTLGGLFTYLLLTYLSRSNRSIYLLKESASRDYLTGLHNPRAFEAIFEQKVLHAMRTHEPFALLMMDIDHFKSVNDTYGHSAGDAVLSEIGELLHHFVRSSDDCARKGGEEFVVLLHCCNHEQARQAGERLRQQIEQHVFPLPDGQQLRITASIGISVFPDRSAEELLDQADQELYRAKNEGRNRVCAAGI